MRALLMIQDYPAWGIMWLMGALLFFSGKICLLCKGHPKAPGLFCFVFLWPGMSMAEWLRKPDLPKKTEGDAPWIYAVECMAAGALLFWGGGNLIRQPWVAGWCGMAGLVLMLHFGLFRLLAICWINKGHDVRPIMINPAAATSLSEFWGRRWNRAFRDLVHPLIFRPVFRRYGAATALWVCFLISGLIHELMISVPAQAGYGLPTIYFLIQATGICLEKKLRRHNWLLTHAFTLLPACLLFHPPFLEHVMLPFMQTLAAHP